MNTHALKALVMALSFIGCNNNESAQSPDLGFENRDVRRIVSLSPSITRAIIDLEAEDLLVGVTTFHPPLKKKITQVGTLVTPSLETIVRLRPDIILLSEEDGAVQQTARLAYIGLPVFRFSRNRDYDSIAANYILLGKMLRRGKLASVRLAGYQETRARLNKFRTTITVAFLVSSRPLMVATNASFIGNIIRDAGAGNAFGSLRQPYALISAEVLARVNPDIIIATRGITIAHLLRESDAYRRISAVRSGKLYAMEDDAITYYTPGDYVCAASEIADIIARGATDHQ